VHSFNSGLVGIAYAFYRLYLIGGPHSFLLAADRIVEATLAEFSNLQTSEGGSVDAFPTTLLHSKSGLWCVRALIKRELDPVEAQRSVDAFVASVGAENQVFDATLGIASTLLGSTLLLNALDGRDGVDVAALRASADRMAGRLHEHLDALDGLNRARLAFAHGTSGILYATMRYSSANGQSPYERSEGILEQFARFAQPVAGGIAWPTARSDDPEHWERSSWCNGSAGIVHMWVLAYDLFENPEYIELARATAYYTGTVVDAVPNLCCGSIGQIYALLKVYGKTGENVWLRRALQLAELSARQLAHIEPDADPRLRGLFSGETGAALLFAELERSSAPPMPVLDDIDTPESAAPTQVR
jgi:serine/threonine-protein kinase